MATIVNPNFNKKTQQEEEQVQKPQIAISSGQAASTPASQGQQVKTPSSGGFTNLSNYLAANKQAGSQISGKVQEGIQKDITKKKESAETEAQQFRNAVDASKTNVQQGQQFLGQITPQNQAQGTLPDFSSITSNPDLLKQFTGLRTGTTQAEAATNQDKEQQEAVNAATDVANTYGKRIGEIQSNDRFGLLKEFLANPKQQYGKGLSSLDNAFLQRDKSKALQNLNQNLQRESVLDTKQRADAMQALTSQAKDVTQQAKDVSDSLKKQTQSNLDATNEFAKNVSDINTARKADQDWAKAQFAKLQKGEAIDPKFADMLGLTQGQRIGDIISRGNVADYLGFGPAEITSRMQSLSPEESTRLNSIYQLAGQQFTSPEQASAAISGLNKFDPTKLQGSYDQMIKEYMNLDTSPTAQAAAQAGIKSLGNVLSDQGRMQQLINNINSGWEGLYDNPALQKEYNEVLMPLHQALFNATGVSQRPNDTAQFLSTLLNNLQSQGYYNTVNIANPNNRDSGLPVSTGVIR